MAKSARALSSAQSSQQFHITIYYIINKVALPETDLWNTLKEQDFTAMMKKNMTFYKKIWYVYFSSYLFFSMQFFQNIYSENMDCKNQPQGIFCPCVWKCIANVYFQLIRLRGGVFGKHLVYKLKNGSHVS